MTEATTDTSISPETRAPERVTPSRRFVTDALAVVARSIVPVLLALGAGAILLLALGRDPITFYSNVWKGGIELTAWQDSAIRAAPLLLIAVGLVVVFRANIWNLGYNGQFLLGAALISGLGPHLVASEPRWFALLVLLLVAGGAASAWTLAPALLKARYETNEIITTLMMSFIGVGVANILIKGPFQDPSVNIPQTRVLPLDKMLPAIPGTRIHIGVLVALAAALLVHFILTRTSFGLRLQILGANPRAARHVGVKVPRLIVMSFLVSGLLIGMAAAADILGTWGYVRANWNPAYGDTVIPFVFLARLNALALIPFVVFYAVLSTGAALAPHPPSRCRGFLLVLVALILLFMTVIEYLGRRRALGASYLTPGLQQALRSSRLRRKTSA